jgi:geranylgeranyl transferase type-2 subunit beta
MSLVSGPGRGGASDNVLHVAKHVEYIVSLDKRSDEYEYWLTEHLRLNGVYWGLTALHILGHPDALPRDGLVEFTMKCWDSESGGFGAAPGHDAHMLYTCSAVQILAMADALSVLDDPVSSDSKQTKRSKIGDCEYPPSRRSRGSRQQVISALQDRSTGVFHGDSFGEPDTRFLYAALNALSLLGLLDRVDVPLAMSFVRRCTNAADGGYGTVPGAESHAGQIFVCLAARSIGGDLDPPGGGGGSDDGRHDRLAAWLSERQVPETGGGLNGRPEKVPDVCYAWWVVSALVMLRRTHWIDRPALRRFVLRCQDPERGGLSDRPGDAVDVFHTHFGVAGLSLLEWSERRDGVEGEALGLEEIDAV